MNVRLVIDSLVRQTTVLIAEVATSAGMRAPLSNLANQVFIDLVRELERQGVGRRVAADMFGLALRSYQQKVQRLSESATDQGTTLWEAVYSFVRQKEVVRRGELLRRFVRDDEAMVKSIIKDLVDTGLVYQTGRGDACVYRIAPDEDLAEVEGEELNDRVMATVWLHVYRDGPLTADELRQYVPVPAALLTPALERLEVDGRITASEGDQPGASKRYASSRFNVPLGDPAGWEAALLDHHRALVTAMCTKLRNGTSRALPGDELGGSTFSFDVWPGHPKEAEVRSLLGSTRRQLAELWDEVTAYNDREAHPSTVSRVTYYFGQSVVEHDDAEREGEA